MVVRPGLAWEFDPSANRGTSSSANFMNLRRHFIVTCVHTLACTPVAFSGNLTAQETTESDCEFRPGEAIKQGIDY